MTSMGKLERMWLTGGVLVGLLLIALAYFVGISPQQGRTAEVRSSVESTELQNGLLQSKINRLRADSNDIAKFEAELKQAEAALPTTAQLPEFLRTVQAIGDASLVTVTSMTVGNPVAVTAPAPATAGPSQDDPAAGDPAKPRVISTGAYSIAIGMQVSGSVERLSRFLTQLQSVQPRAVLVDSVTQAVAPTQAGSGVTMTLAFKAFVAPEPAPPAAATK